MKNNNFRTPTIMTFLDSNSNFTVGNLHPNEIFGHFTNRHFAPPLLVCRRFNATLALRFISSFGHSEINRCHCNAIATKARVFATQTNLRYVHKPRFLLRGSNFYSIYERRCYHAKTKSY